MSACATPAKGFTPAFLDHLKPKDKRIELADKACPGLRLRLEPSGRKSFVWYYNDAGKNRVLTLGRYGESESCLSLAQARKALQTAKERHADGGSVLPTSDAPKTVKELAELFYTRRILPHRKRPDVVRIILDNDIIPKLGTKKLATLAAPTVASMVESVVDRGAKTHAGSVLSVAKQMFRFAEGRGYMDRSPAYSLDRKDLGVIDNVRERYLNAEEIKAVWQAIDKAPRMSVQVRIGLKILLLTGVRTGELLKANWQQIDFNKAEWFIPEENSKTTAWTVPMVPAVRALFHELKEIADDLESPWVMAGRTDGPISDKVTGRAMRRLFELKGKDGEPLLAIPSCSPHDFRRTLRTHLEDLGIEPHIAEKCLNHSLGRIERTYNRNALTAKRREALQKWADFVDLLVTDRANVVRIGGAA
jgi:integrase